MRTALAEVGFVDVAADSFAGDSGDSAKDGISFAEPAASPALRSSSPTAELPDHFPSEISRVAVEAFLKKFLGEWDHGRELGAFYAEDAALTHRVLVAANDRLSPAMPRRALQGKAELLEYFPVRLRTMHQSEKARAEVSFSVDLPSGKTFLLFHVAGSAFISAQGSLRSVAFERTLLATADAPDRILLHNDQATFTLRAPALESRVASSASSASPARVAPTSVGSTLAALADAASEMEDGPVEGKKKKAKKRALDESADSIMTEAESEEYVADSEFLKERVGERKCAQFLNEWCQKRAKTLTFDEKQADADPQKPRFEWQATVAGEALPPGRGRKKKDAKEAAARQALLVLLRRGDDALEPKGKVKGKTDPSSSDVPEEVALSARTRVVLDEAAKLSKTPVTVLGEFCSKVYQKSPSYEASEASWSDAPFAILVTAPDGEKWPVGVGRSKKAAKSAAAALAIDTLVQQGRWRQEINTGAGRVGAELYQLENKKFKEDVFGLVATYVHQTYVALVKGTADKGIKQAKVISGIVMMDDVNKEAFVVSLATGNRCLNGDLVQTDGSVINDSHAEIVARRGLRRFLFAQAVDFADHVQGAKPNKTLFQDLYAPSGKLKVNPRYSFHLYINTAPCGDGRVFTLAEPHGQDGPSDPDRHIPIIKDPKKHGILRSKIERGEGTIPVGDLGTQTMDGIGGGERLRTMSCSDKVLQWNAVGLQGALLSSFMEPVYLSSVTIGSLWHHGHTSRALCCRARGFAPPPPSLPKATPFALRHPHLGSAQDIGSESGRTDCHAKSSGESLNWNFADQTSEVVDGPTGRPSLKHHKSEDGAPLESRLSKRSMLGLTKKVMGLYGKSPEALEGKHYRDVKRMLGFDYQSAKGAFQAHLRQTGLGTWLKRPQEEQMF